MLLLYLFSIFLLALSAGVFALTLLLFTLAGDDHIALD